MNKFAFRFVIPFLAGGLIIGTAGFFIHLYRTTWSPGRILSPELPRSQVTFSVRLPENHSPLALPVLLRVVKDKNAAFSVNYWRPGRTVFQMPLLVPPIGQRATPPSIRLSLWDSGLYTMTLSDAKTGALVRSTTFKVATPLGLYRNDLVLLILLGLAGYLSGRLAFDSLPLLAERLRGLSNRKILFSSLATGGLLLMFSTVVLSPKTAAPVHDIKTTGFHESEGRANAPRMLLPIFPSGGKESGSYLILRHRLDSWLRYGQDLTFFEGPVDRSGTHRAFILPPDDGDYRLSFWTVKEETVTLQHVTVRAIPVSPGFPVGLFLGLTLFSSAFFLLAVTGSRRAISGAMTERLR